MITEREKEVNAINDYQKGSKWKHPYSAGLRSLCPIELAPSCLPLAFILFYFKAKKNIKLINNYSNIIKTQKVKKKKEKILITFWTSRGLLKMKLPEVSFVRIGQIPRLSPPETVFKLIYYTIQEGGRRDGFRFGWKFDKTIAF